MHVFGRNWIFGEFNAAEYQCYLASFESDNGDREEDVGIGSETIETYIGGNPIPIYLGQQYSNTYKLHPKVVITKDSCVTTNEYFSENDVRAILRLTTGKRGYQWMKIITDDIGEDIWYKARVNSVSYQKISGRVAGIIFEMECDSQYAWSTERHITINATANTPFRLYNQSDDLFTYVYPYVEIIPSSSGNLQVVNQDDGNWTVILNGVRANETIRYDCQHEIIDGSRNDSGIAMTNFLDLSNCHFFKLKPDRNTFVSNLGATFKFVYRVPRKVGFVHI